MRKDYTPAQLAEGVMRRGIARLAAAYPFHACLLGQLRLVAAPQVETMGVTAVRDAVRLLHAPEFVLSLPADQLGGVLLHETHHVALGHLLMDPADYEDRWALTVAAEVTVNEFVKEPLPPGGIHLSQFPFLPPMESTERRYQRLREAHKNHAKTPAATIDNHSVWAEAQEDPAAAHHLLVSALQQAALEAGGVPAELRRTLQALGVGTTPGDDVYLVHGGREGRVDWRRLLRRYVGQLLKKEPAFDRPSRRCPELLGILPGQRRAGAQAAVVAVIDTSGSITEENLEEISGELRRLSRSHPVHVIEADCVVQRSYRYRGPLEHVQGRGGTDFRPALERSLLAPLRPGVVIYFTDGHGEAPEEAPPWPLIWCLTSDGEVPAPYGRVVRMGQEGG